MKHFIDDENGYFHFVEDEWKCPICGRGPDDTLDEHHLIPKSKKGKETVRLHRSCHDFLHATFTENEMRDYYNTIETLTSDERVKKFGNWMSKKPHNFYDPSTLSNNRRRKR